MIPFFIGVLGIWGGAGGEPPPPVDGGTTQVVIWMGVGL